MDGNEPVVKTIWVCDYCQVEDFESYEEAVEHETICCRRRHNYDNNKHNNKGKQTGDVLSAKNADKLGSHNNQDIEKIMGGGRTVCCNDQDNSVPHRHNRKSKNGRIAETLTTAVIATPRNPALDIIIPPPLTEPIPQGSFEPLDGSCFACDVCRGAYFRTFEEALYHENLCKQQ
jgi:hypothetical protein